MYELPELELELLLMRLELLELELPGDLLEELEEELELMDEPLPTPNIFENSKCWRVQNVRLCKICKIQRVLFRKSINKDMIQVYI